MTRDPYIYQLFRIVVEENRLLKERISILEERLSHYEQRKSSSNSSIPPSQDPFREKRTRSLREKSGKDVQRLFNLAVSSGSRVNIIQRFADQAAGVYELIRHRIAHSPVVGADRLSPANRKTKTVGRAAG